MRSAVTPDEPVEVRTSAEWMAWLDDQLLRQARSVCDVPAQLIGAYRRERGYADDYHGRELLELLQNANDEPREKRGSVRAALVVSPDGLCVANTGRPFSPDGVASLMTSDYSPKYRHKAIHIGNRGLGFRAVLNWSRCPFILSGSLQIVFDQARAARWLQKLCIQDELLAKEVAKERSHPNDPWPVPILAVPGYTDPRGRVEECLPSAPTFPATWEAAQALRAEGYDTVIGIPFMSPAVHTEALAALDTLGSEFLLFTPHLTEFRIRSPDQSRIWQATRTTKSVTVHSSTGTRRWRLFSRRKQLRLMFKTSPATFLPQSS